MKRTLAGGSGTIGLIGPISPIDPIRPMDPTKPRAGSRSPPPPGRAAAAPGPRLLQERLGGREELAGLAGVDLRGGAEAHPGAAGDGDGPVGALLRRDAAQKREVVAGPLAEGEQVARQAVVDRRLPVGAR